MKKRIIGFLLHWANTSPPILDDKGFYRMKTRLLEKYGTKIGVDVQHILKPCWNCEKGCYKCNTYGIGGGVWDEFWSYLDLYTLGSYRFHVPRERVRKEPKEDITVEGFIRHKPPNFYLYSEAFYWLALFFDRPLFKYTFGRSGHVSKKFTPMVILATMLFHLRYHDSFKRRWKRRFEKLRNALKPKGLTILKIDRHWKDDIPF